MSLRTDPASGTSYGQAYESEPFERPVDLAPVKLEVWYTVGSCGPQVSVRCGWGAKLTGRGDDSSRSIVLPREQWDAMLRELRP